MRAGLIVGGAFLMVFGAFLFLTIFFTLFGILFGFVGFIMFVVGLATSSRQYVPVTPSPQVAFYGPQERRPPPQEQKTIVLVICPQCKSRVPSESKFCPQCGANL